MGHYELLGVEPEASVREIRRCYLERARSSHPDLQTDGSGRAGAEKRMRDLNEAWTVLSDPDGRAAYDRERIRAAQQARPRQPFHAGTAAHETFVPLDDGPTPEFDERHDRPITASRLPGWLVMAPPMLFVGGVIGLIVGGLVGILVIVVGALTALACAVLLFLVAPLVALGTSRRGDRSP